MKRTKNRVSKALAGSRRFGARAWLAIAFVGVAAACDVHGISAPGTVATITVTPNATLVASAVQQMVAVGYDAAGDVVPISPTWTAVSGGTIASNGMFTAGSAAGVYANTVGATVGSISGHATITVTPGTMVSITLVPSPATLAEGATQQFTAVGADAGSNIVAFTPTWSVIAGGGTITQTGLFTAGVASGTYTKTVQVSGAGITATATVIVTQNALATITVTPNPDTTVMSGTQQFTAVGKDANGNVLAPLAIVWSAGAGGTISATGLFTAGTAAGTYANTISATVGAIVGHATVTVTPSALTSIALVPNPATIGEGATQQFTAVGTDAGGNIVAFTPTWSVIAGGGTITQTGLFTAGVVPATYTKTVQVSGGGVSSTATVIVVAGVLTTITVTPNPDTTAVGATQQFVAVGKDASGNILTTTIVWSASAGGAINAATGLFTAGTVTGSFANAVKATSGTVSGTATVVVKAGPLASIVVLPNPDTVATGGTQLFSATGKDASGNAVVFTPFWSVVNGGGTINSNSGLFTAGGTAGMFPNTVQASSGATSGTATVVVTGGFLPLENLASDSLNGVLAGTAVSCTGSASTVNANVSISPGSTISGTCVITGTQHLGDATAAQNQVDIIPVYNGLFSQPCPAANIVSDVGGTTLLPGVYCSASNMGVTGTVTLNGNGNPNAVFVFQVGTGLTTAGTVLLTNGAKARNVYWVVGSSATLGTGSQIQGNIVALTSITLVTGTQLTGRALARNGAVSLGTGSTIILPP